MPRPDPLPRRVRSPVQHDPRTYIDAARARRGASAWVAFQAEWKMRDIGRKGPRKPPEAGVPQPAVPPRGPAPLEGGAEAPLD
ncbi:MAG: hypothetical protein KGL48_00755 [Sphingomonadales bacterium]|nr:hypothetical protein [Sphingomonadales bacterium]MDE2567820.1 hypothetical protein [Sphingomonadales bacterium]